MPDTTPSGIPATPRTPVAAPAGAPAYGSYRQPREGISGWKVFFISLAAVLIGLLVLPILLLFMIGAFAASVANDFADNDSATGSILELDLRQGLTDHPAAPPLFGLAPPSVTEVARKLDAAAEDEDIDGVFVRAGFGGMAPASAEEISEALERFRDSDKFVVAFGQGFENPTLTSYAPLAPAEVWMQRGTQFAVSGLRTEAEYLKGVFDKIGAEPEFAQFYEYKSAADTYDETAMTEPVREATEAWLGSVYVELVDDIARQRGMAVDEVSGALQSAPYAPEAAMEAKMVDRIGYLEEARDRARELAGDEDADFLSIADYTASLGKFSDPVIAIVGGQGPIVPGASDDNPNPFAGGPTFGSDTIAKAIDDAADNDKVEAIVFRVSSPGGSASASDQIDAAVLRAKAAGKPVVVSMGQYAASGGYYVSANADHIVAQPTTITGSIGVLGGKVAFEDSFAKIGYNIDNVEIGGPYTGAYSLDTPFTPEQEAGFRAGLERIYDDFIGVVARGRGMSDAAVREVAKGRVWTGAQALELGLVDELGGMREAIAKARELADIDADSGIRLRKYPKTPTFEEQLSQLLQVSANAQADLAAISAIAQTEEVQAILRAREAAQPLADGQAELRAILPRIVD